MGLMGVWNPPSLSCIATLSIFFFFSASLCAAGSISSSLSSSSDADLLLSKIKPSLQPDHSESDTNPLLTTWNATVPLCQWRGLKWVLSTGLPLPCDDLSTPLHSNASLYRDPSLHILSIHLPSASLSGTVPRELVQLPALRSLSFASNSLSGTVPPELGYSSSLSEIDLANNRLTGPLPPSIWSLCDGALAELRLHGNALSGEVPDPGFSSNSTICTDLRALDLGQNRFSGDFPEFVTRLSGLVELDLGDNLLSGTIPDGLVGLKSLKQLNLSHNNFSGVLPVFPHSNYEAWAFEGNSPDLCGPPLGSCKGKSSSSSGLSAGAVAAIVISLMTGAVVFASLMIGYSQGKRRKSAEEDEIEDGEEYEDENSSGIGGGAEGKLLLFQGGEHLTLEDVLNATGQVTEKTSYGTVYKAKLADGGTIALRLLREGSCVDQSLCLTVIRQLGRIRHENLIPLRAFYQGNRGEKLLIYDYLPTKTLHDLLHDSKAGKTFLNWGRRHKIALGVARGLAHLHTGLETPMVHGNVRSKNVLVDDFFVTRITEFGLDKLMIPSIADEVVALAKSDGYKAPELQRMKKCNSRTDVYAFGILLLEILIGKKPGKNGKSGELVDLPSMVKAAVLEETTMEVFDPEVLKGMRSPMEDGLVQALKLAMGCCAPVASVRPAMDEVVRQLEENRPRNRSALYSPTETRSEIGTPF